jgi:regulatory protein
MARQRVAKPVTAARLEAWAFHYLSRYAASSAHLRKLMQRKIERSASIHGTDPVADAELADALIAKLRRLGLLDDQAFAKGQALSLSRRGHGLRSITARLTAKGLDRAEIETALEALAAENPLPDLTAAAAFARRRRLGPFRPEAARAQARARDLATLGRRGFDYQTARQVVDADSPEALEASLAEALENRAAD